MGNLGKPPQMTEVFARGSKDALMLHTDMGQMRHIQAIRKFFLHAEVHHGADAPWMRQRVDALWGAACQWNVIIRLSWLPKKSHAQDSLSMGKV